MKLREKKPALLIIDMQKGFDQEAHWGGNRNNPQAEEKAQQILTKWRQLKLPIFHIQHSSTEPDSPLNPQHPGFEFKEGFHPQAEEILIIKHVNSAFIETDLKEKLDQQKIDHLVVLGLTSNHCVSTSTRMAGNYGFQTFLVADATATFGRIGIHGEKFTAEIIHATALASLKDEFATILNTEDILQKI